MKMNDPILARLQITHKPARRRFGEATPDDSLANIVMRLTYIDGTTQRVEVPMSKWSRALSKPVRVWAEVYMDERSAA